MKFRALVVAAVGLAVWLAACDLDAAFETYCGFPGRCPEINAAGLPLQISQGTTSRHVVLTGTHLQGIQRVTMSPPGLLTYTGLDSGTGEIVLDVTLGHGVTAGTQVTADFVFDESWDGGGPITLPLFTVTHIAVANSGNDTTGFGTDDNPYATLAHAGVQSGPGDRIYMKNGTYDSIYPDASTPCTDTGAGLRPGVSVEGESRAGTVVTGNGAPGTCAFNLSTNDQVVQTLTIRSFTDGIRVANAGAAPGARPRVASVLIDQSGNNGVVARPGSTLLLEAAAIRGSGVHGLLADGADVAFLDGGVAGSGQAGVFVVGNGGSVVLDEITIENNGTPTTTDRILGAGIVMAADAGYVAVDGGSIANNQFTGITISGRLSTVVIKGALFNTGTSGSMNIAALANSAASIFLGNSKLFGATTNIYVEDFSSFNGGTGDGGWGNNTLSNAPITGTNEIHDARTTTGAKMMTFARTSVHGVTPDAGLPIGSPGDSNIQVYVDHPGNYVDFQ